MSNSLFRNLKNGAKYNALIKTDNCNKVYEGKGNTFFTIELMIKNIQENGKQAVLLAPELKKQSLKETCQSIHSFLYWHFQYKQDEKPQMVRSLNCSWLERFTGIDCKSYSVAGGIILKQLGIKFYIRKIIQEVKKHDIGLGNYSHVYLIVPVNQTTGSLNQGYYTIDGTLPHTTEPFYIKEKSFFMDNNLPHYSLNGPGGLNGEGNTGESNTKDLYISGESQTINYQGLLDSVDVGWFKDFIANIKCWGGSAYSNDRLQQDSDALIGKLNDIIIEINKAIYNQDMIALSKYVSDFMGIATWNASLAGYKKNEGYNSCSTKNIDAIHKVLNFFRYTVVPALQEFLVKYFNVEEIATKQYGRVSAAGSGILDQDIGYIFEKTISNEIEEAYFGQWVTYIGKQVVFITPVYKLSFKGIDVPKFEVAEELKVNINNPGNFNAVKFISQLGTTIVKFTGGGSNPGGLEYDNNNPNLQNYKPPTSKATLAWIGVLLLGGIAFTKMKDKPKVKPKTEK